MSSPQLEEDLRDVILSRPDVILEDAAVMRALVAANERMMGGNVVDMRGIAMDRLEARLDRLEETHRSVIAAAYENLAGTNQIHRAVLTMLDPHTFEDFLRELDGKVAETLRVDAVRLVLETQEDNAALKRLALDTVLSLAPKGFVSDYVSLGKKVSHRTVTLRQIQQGVEEVYGDKAGYIRSEACLKLDFGAGRAPGLLVLGTEDPHQFTAQQGTDLLSFFAGVFERAMRRWLS